jgi:hypothetical protein
MNHENFQLAPLRNQFFLGNLDTFFEPDNSPAPISGGASSVEPKTNAVLRTAQRVWCAVLK